MGNKMDFELDITGNCGRDVDSAYTPNGKLFAKVSVAVEVGYGEYKRTEWVNVTVWGDKQAENFGKFVQKGTRLRVKGEPKVNTWIGKDGEAHASLELTCHEFSILKNGKPKEEEDSTPYDEPTQGE